MTVSRRERAETVAALLGEGLNVREVADRLGLSRAYVYALIQDPDGSRDKERKKQYGRPCVEGCGRTTNGSDGRTGAAKRCLDCERARNEDRNRRIFEAWERGETGREIADREGVTETTVHSLVNGYRRRNGMSLSLHRRRDRELWELIERRWREGATGYEIAAECGTTPENIYVMVRRMREVGIDLPRRTQAKAAA